MKKWFILLSGILIFGSLSFSPSCNVEQPTMGILTITVIDSNGNIIPDEQVFLATSYQDLQKGNYFKSKYTDFRGEVFFMDLQPIYYWYDTEHWEDYGGAQVYAGIEHLVTLVVNTPQP